MGRHDLARLELVARIDLRPANSPSASRRETFHSASSPSGGSFSCSSCLPAATSTTSFRASKTMAWGGFRFRHRTLRASTICGPTNGSGLHPSLNTSAGARLAVFISASNPLRAIARRPPLLCLVPFRASQPLRTLGEDLPRPRNGKRCSSVHARMMESHPSRSPLQHGHHPALHGWAAPQRRHQSRLRSRRKIRRPTCEHLRLGPTPQRIVDARRALTSKSLRRARRYNT